MDLKVKQTSDYKALPLKETLEFLEATSGGLSEEQAASRLAIYGKNEITEKNNFFLLEFLSRYWGPMPWLMELAMVLSLILKHYTEGIIIFALLTINAVIGQLHSSGSRKAIELLKKKLATNARAVRDGKETIIPAKDIVLGDVILVKLGDIVPADSKVINGRLSVDESALTGESLSIDAVESAVIYSGSLVKHGETRCVVINTGANTYFGKTAELVKSAKPVSHQEKVMLEVVKYMLYLSLAAVLAVSIFAMFIHTNFISILNLAVIFLLGAVPVALPAVLTMVQSVGAMELAKKGALVTRLDSIEDSASIDVLCFDKTGTITQNKLSVINCAAFSGYKQEDVAVLAALASREQGMDLIDLAVIEYVKSIKTGSAGYKQIEYAPFDPSKKSTEAIIENDGKRFKVLKGAAQTIITMCLNTMKESPDNINKTIDEFSKKGYRTIAVARSQEDDMNKLKFVGLLALSDPPRPDSKNMIDEARKLGIKPMMLTGDNISIAREISVQTGIGGNIMRFSDIKDLNESVRFKVINEIDGFAEIYPEDKYQIVKLLQSAGHTVGMTGDGVNDAPALKQAEMGIAVSSATDVAKSSASVVLTGPGLQVIIDAVKTSRKIYQRMLTWILNKVTKVIEITGLLAIGFFWLHHMVLSLMGISLLVFANDFVTMSLAGDNVISTVNPDKWDIKKITLVSLIPGMLLVIEDLIVIMACRNYFHLDWEKMRTLIMLNLVFNSQFRVLIIRERRHFWSSMPGKGLIVSSLAAIGMFIFICVYGFIVPAIALNQILAVLILSAVFVFLVDFPKYYLYKKSGL
jgi:H+-transporting ATPase